MIWGSTYKQLFACRTWFAWRPVRLVDGRWAWMCTLQRKWDGRWFYYLGAQNVLPG